MRSIKDRFKLSLCVYPVTSPIVLQGRLNAGAKQELMAPPGNAAVPGEAKAICTVTEGQKKLGELVLEGH